jgi:hypothetical protein
MKMNDYMLVNVSARIVIYSLVVAALFGCGGTNATPSAAPSPTSSPVARNPSSTTITVENGKDARLALAQVTLSSSVDGVTPEGSIYGTQMTGTSGQVTFHDLPAFGQVCATASERFYTTVSICKQPFAAAQTIVLP